MTRGSDTSTTVDNSGVETRVAATRAPDVVSAATPQRPDTDPSAAAGCSLLVKSEDQAMLADYEAEASRAPLPPR